MEVALIDFYRYTDKYGTCPISAENFQNKRVKCALLLVRRLIDPSCPVAIKIQINLKLEFHLHCNVLANP